jgi:hypothetical protein
VRRYRVLSEAIKTVGYDEDAAVLEVEFRSGAVYDYEAVAPEEVLELLQSDSLGRWFGAHIRRNHAARRVA